METKLTSDYMEKMERRDAAICAEWQLLTSDPRNSRVKVNKYLAEKYNLFSIGSVYAVLRKNGIRRGSGKSQKLIIKKSRT